MYIAELKLRKIMMAIHDVERTKPASKNG